MSVVANVAINVDAANAIQQLNRVKTASQNVQGGFKAASAGAQGLGTALTAALGPLLTVTAALAAVQKGLNVAFERGAAEQRLRNLTGSTEEFNAAMALASESASKFGLTQTDASKALADVYGRLKGVGFGLQETGQIYQGFNAIALQSGLAGEEAAGAFFQLSQALGKGKLNGDEFVIVAERMPQLLDAIAQTTGRSRGELTQMAQDGKITSQVLYEALSGAATASDNLNGKLTAQQQTFNNLRQVTDNLLNTLGQVFAPVVVAGAEGLAKVGQMMVDWYGYLGNVIFPRVQEALQPVITSLKAAFEDINFDAIRVAIQSILIKGFEIAIGVISNFSSVLSVVIDGFKALSQNPVFQFIAEQVGRLAGFLGLTNDKVGQFKEEQNKAAAATADTVKNYSSLPAVVDDAKEKAKQLKDEQQKILESTKTQNTIREQAYDNEININKALGNNEAAYSAIVGKIQQGYMSRIAELDVVKSQGKITSEQYDLESQLAALKRDGAKATAEAEEKQRKQNEQLEKAKNITEETVKQQEEQVKKKVEELQKQKEIAGLLEQSATISAQNADSEKLKAVNTLEALKHKREQVELEYELATAGKLSNSEFTRAAQSLRDAKLEAIGISENLQRAVLQAERLAGVSIQTPVPDIFGEAGKNQEFINAYLESMRELDKQIVSVTTKERMYNDEMARFLDLAERYNKQLASERRQKASMDLQKVFGYIPFANGGYVTKPTNALIGEGGDSEYVIPSSKMSTAMANYAAGKRGASILSPQVNISTGPVMQMDGTNYVTMNDLQQATSAAARQGANLALNQLQTNPTVRRQVGVAR